MRRIPKLILSDTNTPSRRRDTIGIYIIACFVTHFDNLFTARDGIGVS